MQGFCCDEEKNYFVWRAFLQLYPDGCSMGIVQVHVWELVPCMFAWVLNLAGKTAVMEDWVIPSFGMEILLPVLMAVGGGCSEN